MSHNLLDARNLLCPLPVIRVQERVQSLAAGDTLEVTCTDPGAQYDIPAWCRVHGHQVISCIERDGCIVLAVRVGAG